VLWALRPCAAEPAGSAPHWGRMCPSTRRLPHPVEQHTPQLRRAARTRLQWQTMHLHAALLWGAVVIPGLCRWPWRSACAWQCWRWQPTGAWQPQMQPCAVHSRGSRAEPSQRILPSHSTAAWALLCCAVFISSGCSRTTRRASTKGVGTQVGAPCNRSHPGCAYKQASLVAGLIPCCVHELPKLQGVPG
jgi:hypothetical protein